MLSIAEVDRQRAMDMCTGIADKVLLKARILDLALLWSGHGEDNPLG
jgi:hypothetical protein